MKVSDANVFGIRVGVSINLFVKTKRNSSEQARIFYHRIDEGWNKAQKFEFLKTSEDLGNVPWQTLQPDGRYTWLTEGLHPEFDDFIPIGTKEAKAMKDEVENVIFHKFSTGIVTARDAWAYNFNRDALAQNITVTIEAYNAEVDRWNRQGNQAENLDDFVLSDDTKIKWSSSLKQKLKSGQIAEFSDTKIRQSLYRPFTKSTLFFDRMMNQRVHVFPSIFPTPETEQENQVICVGGYGRKEFAVLMSKSIPDFNFYVDPQQSFPFYTYNEDGTNRRENITDWALAQFRATIRTTPSKSGTSSITSTPSSTTPTIGSGIRQISSATCRVCRTPLDFWAFATAGKRLGEIHIQLRRRRRISAPFHRNPRYPAQLARRKNETVQRQYTTDIQRVPDP